MLKTDHLADCWQGRVDTEDAELSRRIHQQITYDTLPDDFDGQPVLLGFASDEGVRRNQGRPGAKDGPIAARQALANLACASDAQLYDIGDVCCDTDLETAHQTLSHQVHRLLEQNARPIVLGGGHEVAWGSYSGLRSFLSTQAPNARLGILNFDAHFDLRNPNPKPSSGTPFRQAQQWCEANETPFDYFVCGINPSANTDALFEFAYEHDVQWVEDLDCHWGNISNIQSQLTDWLAPLDALYITVCLDVFPAADAPGVSAPSAVGVPPAFVLKLLQTVQGICEQNETPILLADVAELNPTLDLDGRTAKLAARIAYQLMF
ncbi:formimidoylglutamase [Reinekea blandensis]|uniref:Formimidoylglutamase n=1 Tax=Reinekea blandensis MED297 TaxID=314283 RepID=A4BIU5_9GAMM|nr:formimidoylglutamase [Reinekea blandensis]EAR07962.1 probable arginase family protein [Reinekea sp. MED297] [Reinekea blandensis MED297]